MSKDSFAFKDGIRVVPTNALPTNPRQGDIFYLLPDNKLKYFDGKKWLDFDSNVIYPIVSGMSIPKHYPVYVSKGYSLGDLGRESGKAYILDPNHDHRMEFIGVAEDSTPINSNFRVITGGSISLGSYLIENGSFVPGEMVYWNGVKYTTTEPQKNNFWLIKVGKAISTNSMVVNSDLGASAVFLPAAENVLTINNNITTPITLGISFNPLSTRAYKIYYQVSRKAGGTEIVESGIISGHYNAALGQWSLVNYGISGDAGVDFTMSGSNIMYTSTNMSGFPYIGNIYYRIETEISGYYDFSDDILNDVSTPLSINGLFLPPEKRAMFVFYYVVRRFGVSSEISESGLMNVVRNFTTNSCEISVSSVNGDADVLFDITSGGQITYTSSNITINPYNGGKIYWKILNDL